MSKARKPAAKDSGMTFENLVFSISGVDKELAAQAGRAVNISITLRNWLIGCYIAEYEMRGADRARYGEKLLEKLSGRLIENRVSRAEERELRRYRQFYQTYSQIRESLTPELTKQLASHAISPSGSIRESATPESTRHWWNTPLPVWTTGSSSRGISFTCPRPKHCAENWNER
jgi:hypothetical protein